MYDYSKIKVETGVPIPNKKGRKPSGIKEILESMKVGDSVVVPHHNQYDYVRYVMRRLGYKMTMRTLDDGSRRIWRIKND